VTASGTVLNTPSNQQTADLVGTVTTLGGVGANQPYYDTKAWAQPTGVRFGTTGRNQFYGPGGWSLDLSMFRAIALGGTKRLEFRVEGQNFLNHPVFGNPDGNVTSATFMQISNIPGGAAGNVGLGNAVYMERNFRLGLRFSF
jgi:hypothetical protein